MSTHELQLSKLKNLLENEKANYSIFIDDFSFDTASEGAKNYGITMEEATPTLILKTKTGYYAVIIRANTRISFKKLKIALGVKELTMAEPELVLSLTGAKVGQVGLINSELPTIVDQQVLSNENCYGGCGVPKATLRISTADLVRITQAKILDFSEPRSLS